MISARSPCLTQVELVQDNGQTNLLFRSIPLSNQRPKRIYLTVLIFSFWLSAAAEMGASSNQNSFEILSLSGVQNFLSVPLFSQGTDFSCGVSSMQSVLKYYDTTQDHFESDITKSLGVDPDSGILIRQIKAFAQAQGFRVQIIRDMTMAQLFDAIRAGRPVIALIQAWPEKPGPWRQMKDEGHYVVVNGFDFENVYLMDPIVSGNYGFIPIQEFDERWHLEDDEFGTTEIVEHVGIILSKPGQPNFRPGVAIRVR